MTSQVYEGAPGTANISGFKRTSKRHLVSPIVMCGPRGVRFLKPATLTMPRFHTHNQSLGRRSLQTPPWNLAVIHAATQSDGTTSSSETEGTRQWHRARLKEGSLPTRNDADVHREEEEEKMNLEELYLGMESDSSGAGITCQIADSMLSILIDHF